MKLSIIFLAPLLPFALADYAGDIVAFWNVRTTFALNASSPRLSSLREGYYGALVQTAVLKASDDSQGLSRNTRQLALSHAAHDILTTIFPAQYRNIDAYLREAEDQIQASVQEARRGREIGERAVTRTVAARAGDGVARYIRYDFKTPAPGVYQGTPPTNGIPADPNGPFIKPFGGVKQLPVWIAPPDVRSEGYIAHLQRIKEKGARVNSTRTAEETEIGYYWLESSITYWNRFARAIVGNSLSTDISKSAKFFAQLNWAIANAGTIGFDAKHRYNSWRPITALRWTEPFLFGGADLSDPTWEPLVTTPVHQDYLSGHAVYGSSAGGIIAHFLGTDTIDPPVTLSSTVTVDNVGVLTRTYRNVSTAVKENGDSRVFVGVHFQFASDEGNKAGQRAADDVWRQDAKGYL
ncbi:hypothetical protein NLJ89_g2180 [Agrocybe chaxingu]|uniref:Phosphatidic acid phosphatase type 2/haloperoxidase domain-containing protein n=1 Tax=Agrocybe chaxingu TaxID=84603 RepID=A0A9W8K6D8_9AGAR|nr:hypothetical protein NLJ89_g2180 [Agrocybe chaxingu]